MSSGARRSSISLGTMIVALAVGALASGGAASAAPVQRDHVVNEPYTYEMWDCGYPITVDGVGTHLVTLRQDPRLADNLLFMDQYSFRETWTNDHDQSVTVTGQGVAKNLQSRHVADSVYTFTFIQSGQPFTITDSSGRLVSRDRGTIRFETTVDVSNGVEIGSGVSISGPHPLFGNDTCRVIAPLMGTDSARHQTPRPLGTTEAGMGYVEYLPPSYSAVGDRSPLLVVTNGYGENGDGSAGQLSNLLLTGIPRFIDVGGWPTARPLVVLSTQHVEDPPGVDFSPCDGVTQWPGSCAMQLQHDRNHASPAGCTTPREIHDFIAYAVEHYNVDPSRVYLTGLSCGAFGAWEYLAAYGASQVAAAVPVAGDGRYAWASAGCALGDVPLWAFHGGLDDVVNPLGSTETMENVRACPGVNPDAARLTVYPDLMHDGWDQAYSGSRGDDIYSWMLSYSRP